MDWPWTGHMHMWRFILLISHSLTGVNSQVFRNHRFFALVDLGRPLPKYKYKYFIPKQDQKLEIFFLPSLANKLN